MPAALAGVLPTRSTPQQTSAAIAPYPTAPTKLISIYANGLRTAMNKTNSKTPRVYHTTTTSK